MPASEAPSGGKRQQGFAYERRPAQLGTPRSSGDREGGSGWQAVDPGPGMSVDGRYGISRLGPAMPMKRDWREVAARGWRSAVRGAARAAGCMLLMVRWLWDSGLP